MATLHTNSAVPVMAALASAIAACLWLPARALAAEPVTESVESGAMLFGEHCARCHGADAAGNGPDALTVKVPPPDLTQIANRAGGTFPAPRIFEIITYGGDISAHGPAEMPVWGKVFSVKGGGGRVGSFYSRRASIALKRYLESIQK